jgi:quercetin dioxygenase-like cupin family protein
MTKYNMNKNPVHLGLGATAVVEPEMTGDMEWYGGYAERHGGDGAEGRLVSLFTFTEPWTMWEMHPKGTEVVMCTAGEMTLIQELADGTHDAVKISAGEFVINPPGVWHTADVDGTATALFITAGEGTEHRPR